MAIPVVASIDFECLQVNWQFAQRKRRYATRCKIKSRTALCFGPMHVVGVLVSHEQGQCSTKEHSHLGWVAHVCGNDQCMRRCNFLKFQSGIAKLCGR